MAHAARNDDDIVVVVIVPMVQRSTRQHHPYPPLALSPLGHPIARGQRATTQSLPCVRACPHRAPRQLPGAPQPRVPTPLPAPPPHTHPRPPKVNHHVTFARLFSIPRVLTGSPATSVPHSARQQGIPLMPSLSPPKKNFLRGKGPGWPGGPLGNFKNWKVNSEGESGYTGRLRKPDRREEQMDSRDGQMDGTGGWTDWRGRWDEPDGRKPDGC